MYETCSTPNQTYLLAFILRFYQQSLQATETLFFSFQSDSFIAMSFLRQLSTCIAKSTSVAARHRAFTTEAFGMCRETKKDHSVVKRNLFVHIDVLGEFAGQRVPFVTEIKVIDPKDMDIIPAYRIMDQQGNIIPGAKLPEDVTEELAVDMYKHMIRLNVS